MKYLLLSFLLISLCLNAKEFSATNSLASTEGLLDMMVAGHVCPISGDYVDTEVDLVLPGPSPLVLQRSYCSSDTFSGHLKKSWQLFDPNQLITSTDFADKNAEATVTTTFGARARYKQWEKIKDRRKSIKYAFCKTRGYTNCGTGILSGKTNLKNNDLVIKIGKILLLNLKQAMERKDFMI